MIKITPTIRKAVKDYYKYQGAKQAIPIRFVTNKHSTPMTINGELVDGYTLLLAHFIDEDGDDMSSLLSFTDWKNGHWDVTEETWCLSSREANMIRNFEDSREYL